MRFRLVIFDMDGTLADTSQGIVNSHRYAHRIMGRPEPSDEELAGVIGGPLLETYRGRFAFPEEEAREAVRHYRSYYAEKGLYEASLYPAMADTLQVLRDRGALLAVATLKAEPFAKELVRRWAIEDRFAVVFGMDRRDSRTKADLIRLSMESLKVPAERTVLVGDSLHDWKGAQEAGVTFLGVTYGFGFAPEQSGDLFQLCASPRDIPEVLERGPF